MIITLYVDDIIIASNNKELEDAIVSSLKDNFDITDLKEPRHCVGLEIERTKDKLSIKQTAYIKSLVRKYGLEEAKPLRIPLPANFYLEKEPKVQGEAVKVNQTKYQELIGSLLHLSVFSRPDISCAVNMLSQFNQDPRKQHWNSALKVVRYLKTTMMNRLEFRKTGKPLVGFVDANWAQDLNDRRSQSGFFFLLAGAAISWESRKQKVVAMSSAESEYIALTEAAKEAAYLKYVLEEMEISDNKAITVFSDSQSAQHMAKFGSHHARTKHIHYKYHFIKDAIESGIVDVVYKPTENMPADFLTKPVPKPKHDMCCHEMGFLRLKVEEEC